jgi:LuxR family maltose regulon positive regulatory protein
LLVFRAWGCLLGGQAAAIPPCLQQAQQAAAEMPDVDSELTGHVAAIRAYLAALQGDVATTITQAQNALACLSPQSLSVRSVVAFVLGGMYTLAGDLPAAQTTFAEAAQMGQTAGNHQAAVPAWCAVASLQATQGRLRQAETTYRKALDLSTSARGRPLPLAAQPYGGLAEIAYERNDLDAASEWLDASLALG